MSEMLLTTVEREARYNVAAKERNAKQKMRGQTFPQIGRSLPIPTQIDFSDPRVLCGIPALILKFLSPDLHKRAQPKFVRSRPLCPRRMGGGCSTSPGECLSSFATVVGILMTSHKRSFPQLIQPSSCPWRLSLVRSRCHSLPLSASR
jgi:hypothetical protein